MNDLNVAEYKGHLPKDDDEEVYDWVEESLKTDGSQTFFTYVNETRSVLKKGTQALNSYGNRSNAHLIVNYGFTFENNVYDSFEFFVNLKRNQGALSVEEMIARQDQTHYIQQIKLKKDQFSQILMCYIRDAMKDSWLEEDGKGQQQPLASICTNMDFEEACLQRYHEII